MLEFQFGNHPGAQAGSVNPIECLTAKPGVDSIAGISRPQRSDDGSWSPMAQKGCRSTRPIGVVKLVCFV